MNTNGSSPVLCVRTSPLFIVVVVEEGGGSGGGGMFRIDADDTV